MPNKLISLHEAVAKFTWDGMIYASGGGLPVGSDTIVFGREMVRQGRKNIHYLSHCTGQQGNLLCAAGVVSKMEGAFTGLEVFGFANGLRRAVESGKVVYEDWSNLSMALRFMGGALRWPFIPATVNIGSDMQWRSGFNPEGFPCTKKIPEVVDPFTGKVYGALPPARAEVATIHVTMADVDGNAIFIGTEWNRYELARAADKVVLVADYIVDTDCMRQYPNLVRIPDLLVDAVIPWQLGAWPACSTGVYDSDEDHMFLMNKMLGTEEGSLEYKAKFIDSWNTFEEYTDMIGKAKAEKLMNNVTTHLMTPYMKWVRTDSELKDLFKDSKFCK